MSAHPAPRDDYGADSIKVLKGLDAVRKRPGMYIGDTDDGSGLHHMVYEVVDNGIDEALAGHANAVSVTIHADGSVSVSDNGRGIPTDIHTLKKGVSAAEVIMTQLHAGGKVRPEQLQGLGRSARGRRFGGQRAVGLAGPAHLAGRQGALTARFERGDTVHPAARHRAKSEGKQGDRGAVHGLDSTTFSNLEYSFKTLENRLRELAFLNSGVRITLEDQPPGRKVLRSASCSTKAGCASSSAGSGSARSIR
jgi:DNA gyrase subunit B